MFEAVLKADFPRSPLLVSPRSPLLVSPSRDAVAVTDVEIRTYHQTMCLSLLLQTKYKTALARVQNWTDLSFGDETLLSSVPFQWSFLPSPLPFQSKQQLPAWPPTRPSTKHGCTPVRTLPAADDGWCKFAGSLYPYLSCIAEGSEYVNVSSLFDASCHLWDTDENYVIITRIVGDGYKPEWTLLLHQSFQTSLSSSFRETLNAWSLPVCIALF
jgi:hypothetical protein